MSTDPTELFNAFRDELDPLVGGATLGLLALFVVVWFTFKNQMTHEIIPGVMDGMLSTFGWLFLAVMVVSVLFALAVIAGPWRGIRLGGPDATPTYSYPAYFAMFFSAGIAAGIVFWAPSEVLFHYQTPPPFVDAAAETSAAASGALQTAFFHWGLSPWAAYVAIGLPIGYYAYNKGAPLRISSLLLPFIGKERLNHPAAKLVDILAVFATIGGLATSVGLVSNQLRSGANTQFGVSSPDIANLAIVLVLTVLFTGSAILGVKKGIRRASGINVTLFTVAAIATLVGGPTVYILSNGSLGIVSYLVNFVTMSFAGALSTDSWFSSWTLFYWVWWFSWAPFAGLFLASISRGRRLWVVAATGVFATTAATLAWFAIISGTALQMVTSGAVDLIGTLGQSYDLVAFPLFNALPLGSLLVLVFFGLILTWIVTSADTATLTVAILTTEPNVAPGTASRLFWGTLQGVVAWGVLQLGGANALQSAAVITGGPFAVVALIGILGFAKDFYESGRREETVRAPARGDD